MKFQDVLADCLWDMGLFRVLNVSRSTMEANPVICNNKEHIVTTNVCMARMMKTCHEDETGTSWFDFVPIPGETSESLINRWPPENRQRLDAVVAKHKFCVLSLLLYTAPNHAGLLVFDKEKKVQYFFDPYGRIDDNTRGMSGVSLATDYRPQTIVQSPGIQDLIDGYVDGGPVPRGTCSSIGLLLHVLMLRFQTGNLPFLADEFQKWALRYITDKNRDSFRWRLFQWQVALTDACTRNTGMRNVGRLTGYIITNPMRNANQRCSVILSFDPLRLCDKHSEGEYSVCEVHQMILKPEQSDDLR